MVKKKHGVIIETPMEARQAEPGRCYHRHGSKAWRIPIDA
jgi:hypothetical protein